MMNSTDHTRRTSNKSKRSLLVDYNKLSNRRLGSCSELPSKLIPSAASTGSLFRFARQSSDRDLITSTKNASWKNKTTKKAPQVTFCIKRLSAVGEDTTDRTCEDVSESWNDSMNNTSNSQSLRKNASSGRLMDSSSSHHSSSSSTTTPADSSAQRESLRRTLALRKSKSLRNIDEESPAADQTSNMLRVTSKTNIVYRTGGCLSSRSLSSQSTHGSNQRRSRNKLSQGLEQTFNQGCSNFVWTSNNSSTGGGNNSRRRTSNRRTGSNRSLLLGEQAQVQVQAFPRNSNRAKSLLANNKSLLGQAPMTILKVENYNGNNPNSNERQTQSTQCLLRQLSEQSLLATRKSLAEQEQRKTNRRRRLRQQLHRQGSVPTIDTEFEALEALLLGKKSTAVSATAPPTSRRVPAGFATSTHLVAAQ